MISQKILRTMNITTAGMLVGAVGVGLLGWFADGYSVVGLSGAENTLEQGRRFSTAGNDASDRASTIESLLASEIWSRPLQAGFQIAQTQFETVPKPLIDPTPHPAVPQDAVVLDLGLRLVGTVVEQGKSMAIAIDRQGKLDFRGEGDEFQLVPEGVHVDAILIDSIRVSFQGQASTWRLGQSLTIDAAASALSAPAVDAAAPAIDAAAPARSRPMSIQEELNSLNGDSPSGSF